jgi:hypothetical protein
MTASVLWVYEASEIIKKVLIKNTSNKLRLKILKKAQLFPRLDTRSRQVPRRSLTSSTTVYLIQ